MYIAMIIATFRYITKEEADIEAKNNKRDYKLFFIDS